MSNSIDSILSESVTWKIPLLRSMFITIIDPYFKPIKIIKINIRIPFEVQSPFVCLTYLNSLFIIPLMLKLG
jgi:hypothetical protein